MKQSASEEEVRPGKSEPILDSRRPQRVDFDDRLLQGQTNRLGAVYLYQRKSPVLPSLLDQHKSFRDEIQRDVLE